MNSNLDKPLTIISWNVNGIRSVYRKGKLEELIEQYTPDVLALQEIKCPNENVPNCFNGYELYINSGECLGRHGTIFAVSNSLNIRDYFFDTWEIDGNCEGRVIVLFVGELSLINSYTVNIKEGLTRATQRDDFDHKLLYTLRMCKTKTSKPILMGDLNVISDACDIHRKVLRQGEPCQTPLERGNFKKYLDLGFTDVWRHFNKSPYTEYTYWSNFGRAREKNLGWRLDYFLADNRLIDNVTSVEHLSHFTGSDHCPIMLQLNTDFHTDTYSRL